MIGCGLVSCDTISLPLNFKGFSISEIKNVAFDNGGTNLFEVAPPNIIQKLAPILEQSQPQVTIDSPRDKSTVTETNVEVKLTVEGYSLFKDDRLNMGPHLNLTLDNESYQEIYDLEEPIILRDLKPGTHTIRLLAETPWHESFKNQTAYAQTTFNVLTETTENNPDRNLPLLTYNQPNGSYSKEPILLDFYLTNVDTDDWQVQATINGESFILDRWQPVYLKGFQEGNNLIQLELLDSTGKAIANQFNQPIRLINYNPASSETSTLAKLVTDEISFTEAVAIVEPNYYIQPVDEPEIVETITEELSLEAPEEEVEEVDEVIEIEESVDAESSVVTPEAVIVDEKTVPTIEEEIEESLEEVSETETKETAIEENASEKAIAVPLKEDMEKVDETPTEDTEKAVTKPETSPEIIPQKIIESQKSNNEEIPAKYFSNQKKVSTNSVIEETASLKTDNGDKLQEITKIPVTVSETVKSTDMTEEAISSDTEKPDTIATETPQPRKLKVPQWWKDLVANLQQRLNFNT